MKKFPLFIIILLALGLFAAADYYLNNLDAQVVLDLRDQQVSDVSADKEPSVTIHSLFQLNEKLLGYTVTRQVQTSQIFEKIDLSSINNISIYRNQLEKVELPGTIAESDKITEDTKSADLELAGEPVFLYEIHGPKDQGSITYLNVKLQFITQINATTETINEDSAFGHNSFYFNNKNYQNTAFLLTQIGNNLFGFQYNKKNPDTHEDIKAIVAKLMEAPTQ